MTRSGGKVPFPMPQQGVVSDQHPFAVGTGNLARSQNWYNEDGIFRTRDGLLSVDPPRRWWEALTLLENLVPMGLAEGDVSGIAMMGYDSSAITVTVSSDSAPFGDQQYIAEYDGGSFYHGSYDAWITTVIIDIDPGLPYTAWMFSGEDTVAGDITLEFMDADDDVIESHDLEGDAVLHGLWQITKTAPQTATGVRFKLYPEYGRPLYFGPMKIAQGDEILAWTYGDGYGGDPGDNLYDVECAHPQDEQAANAAWTALHGKEQISVFSGEGILGLFDGYESMPVLGRATAFAVQPTRLIPSIYETAGIELSEDYRADVTAGDRYNISVSFYIDYETELIPEVEAYIDIPFYNEAGNEINTRTIHTVLTVESGGVLSLTSVRTRAELTLYAPSLAVAAGLRVKLIYPTAKREIVYDNYAQAVYDDDGSLVTIEEDNRGLARIGIIVDDIKMVNAYGADARWWDFSLPDPGHTGPYGYGEFPLNYLPHDYLFEGATETNRIVMATDQSLWKWDDTNDIWTWIGWDLGTIYSAWYLMTTDDEGAETYTVDDRISFVQTDDAGYTADAVTYPGDEDTLSVEITLPAASADSTTPEPGGWWKYRINGGDWSGEHDLTGESPILEAIIEYNGREIGAKIILNAVDNDDFADECVIPDGFEGGFDDPVFEGTITSRKHDGQTGETLFHADRDNPVDMRGYDFGQKTYLICANKNDTVVAWDGQDDSKVERAGGNAPYAKTICISGGRVLAGNVRFEDPYSDLNAPLAVVYTDTFLSQGFRNWHPELAIRLADTPGEVVKLLEMGTLAVSAYKTDAVYMLVYQTGNNPFRTQLMASSIPGPVSVRGVAAMTENTHLFLGTDGGIYQFDGSYPRQLSQSISLTIESELDLSYKDRAFISYSPRLRAALCMYPTKGSDGAISRGMWIDIDKQAGWPFEWNPDYFDFTAGAPVQTVDAYEMGGVTMRLGSVASALAAGQSLQPDFFLGGYDGTTYVMDRTASDDWGQAIWAHFRTGLTEFGLQSKYSLLKEIEFLVNRTNTAHDLDVEVWASNYGTDAKPVSHETIDISQEGPYEAEVREKARFWGYGLSIQAYEQIIMNGAFGAVRVLGDR